MKAKIKKSRLEEIWVSVPVDYYQKSVSNNLGQRWWHLNKLKVVTEMVGFRPKKILDVGCASGWFLKMMINKFPECRGYGVDVYKNAVYFGRENYPNLDLRVADAHRLPFSNEYFDVVVCNEVLEHVVDPIKVLLEMRRVVKKEGLIVVEMDSGSWLFRTIWGCWTYLKGKVWHDAHIQVFDTKMLKETIERAGLRVERQKIFNLGMAVVFGCRRI